MTGVLAETIDRVLSPLFASLASGQTGPLAHAGVCAELDRLAAAAGHIVIDCGTMSWRGIKRLVFCELEGDF